MTVDEKLDLILDRLAGIDTKLRDHDQLLTVIVSTMAGLANSVVTINTRLDALFHRMEDIESRLSGLESR